MISVANLCSDLGWDRFSKQKNFKVAGFYFMSPDIVKQILTKNGFVIEEMRAGESDNLYYKRDICLLI